MFYKVENEVLIPAPEKGIKVFIANPTAEQYALVGYTDKIVEDDVLPEVEGKIIESYYEQSDGVIYKRYRYYEVPEEMPNEIETLGE
jgi:hypothetical protein